MNKIQNYYPQNEEDQEIIKTSPAWKKIEEYIQDQYELEENIFSNFKEVEEMMIRAYATYHFELSNSATRGEQEVQGEEYAFKEMKAICDSFFRGILKK